MVIQLREIAPETDLRTSNVQLTNHRLKSLDSQWNEMGWAGRSHQSIQPCAGRQEMNVKSSEPLPGVDAKRLGKSKKTFDGNS